VVAVAKHREGDLRIVGRAIESDVSLQSRNIRMGCRGLRSSGALRVENWQNGKQGCQQSGAEGQAARHSGDISLRKG
jgi:hypothetical protein